MKFITLSLSVITGLSLSACVVHENPAQTHVVTPYGSVKYHCPPGQAKKGNCHPAGGYHHYHHY